MWLWWLLPGCAAIKTERQLRRKKEGGTLVIIMAEAAPPQLDDNEIFVYMGGDQRVPDGVRRARIHISVKIIRARAFYRRRQLIYVEFHDGIEAVEEEAFFGCVKLRGMIKLLGVKIIKQWAFCECGVLSDVEFGNKLETIEMHAFLSCKELKKIRMPSVRTIGSAAFGCCKELSDVEFGEELRTLKGGAFYSCSNLERIALPLKGNMIGGGVFDQCPRLLTVDLVGGIHSTAASLHLESWRNEMNNQINSINQTLSTITVGKTLATQQWMRTVINQIDHYRAEHKALLKEATTLLELALWKANLRDNNSEGEREGVRTTRGSRKRARKEICVTSGAHVVIKNVLPFLQLLE